MSSRRWITVAQIARIHALTKLGRSQGEIARDVDASKTVVARVQQDKHKPRMLGRFKPALGPTVVDAIAYAREQCRVNLAIRAVRGAGK